MYLYWTKTFFPGIGGHGYGKLPSIRSCRLNAFETAGQIFFIFGLMNYNKV